jgi:uncharacterized protein
MTLDLTPQELDQLDDLLGNAPEGLEPMDTAMLDGFLCGMLVQPEVQPLASFLPRVLMPDESPLPEGVDPVWLKRVTALIERRHVALRRALAEDQWFDPIVIQFDEGDENGDQVFDKDDDVFNALPVYSKPLVPFASGFVTALNTLPNGLLSFIDDDSAAAIDRVMRHLPAETGEERAVNDALDIERPLKTLDDAVEDLVLAVVELDALTEPERYRVEPVRHEQPKVGRNDPCPCGSGKKYKHCHGQLS